MRGDDHCWEFRLPETVFSPSLLMGHCSGNCWVGNVALLRRLEQAFQRRFGITLLERTGSAKGANALLRFIFETGPPAMPPK